MERRPVRTLEEARIYHDQLVRIRHQLRLLREDRDREPEVFARASLDTDIRRLCDVEAALLASVNAFLVPLGRPPVQ